VKNRLEERFSQQFFVKPLAHLKSSAYSSPPSDEGVSFSLAPHEKLINFQMFKRGF
jgi:hypothetical protein